MCMEYAVSGMCFGGFVRVSEGEMVSVLVPLTSSSDSELGDILGLLKM